jgi:hypothetical protein
MRLTLSLLLVSVMGFAAEQTWTGQITDSMCGANHSAMSSGGKAVNPHDCTLVCTKGGAKFAFVSKGKVFDIADQNFADLTEHAGHTVSLTGDLGSDVKTITVSKLAMNK